MRVLDEALAEQYALVESTARDVLRSYGFREFRTPILERTELFVRSVGESTDIVGKEMYTFEDRGGRSMTLRPEGTAPVVRAVVERGLRNTPLPLKLFYIGPFFRYERPQKGRYRQFQQIGAELIGDARPEADAEVIQMLVEFLSACGFSGLEVALQTLGDDDSRSRFRDALLDYLEPLRDQLSSESRARLATNPLRILDSKAEVDRAAVADAPAMEAFLSESARAHFERLQELLRAAEITFRIEPRLVRGLDYYTGTVFEISSADLGSQNALVGGGRYDNLVADLGGPPTPAIGFAIGLDRVCEAMPAVAASSRTRVAVLALSAGAEAQVVATAGVLRQAGMVAEVVNMASGVGKALQLADRRGSDWAVLIGDDELANGSWSVKNMASGEQQSVGELNFLVELIEEGNSDHD